MAKMDVFSFRNLSPINDRFTDTVISAKTAPEEYPYSALGVPLSNCLLNHKT